jgi:GNAT superfamily N-acetyltransferase
MAPRGFVAGVATLRPIIPFGLDFLLPAAPALKPGAADLGLYVEPEWRRRGIGSRLLAAVRERAVGPSLLTDVAAGSPGETFCRRHGFRHTLSRRHDLLTYCDVHEAWLGELIDTAHPGDRLAHWSGDLSDVSQVETLLRSPSRPGNALLTVAEADGDLAAYAIAVVGAPPQPRARQYGPAVSPGHRGRRLDHWVNAALIQRLREAHPHVNEIQTHTAEDDPGLLATREDLGFRPVRRTHLYELSLS